MRHFFEASRRLSLLFRRLETCGKPFAAAEASAADASNLEKAVTSSASAYSHAWSVRKEGTA